MQSPLPSLLSAPGSDDSPRPKAVVLLSGGLDSATAAAQAQADGFDLIALSCRYGQRHACELASAQRLGLRLGCLEHHVVDVNLDLWGGSSLTDLQQVLPRSGLNGGIPSTYVPGRNTVFIALALSLAEARQAEAIYLGINAVDYSGYPDCRPDYLAAYQRLASLSSKMALEGHVPKLRAPLVKDSKVEIVRRALRLGVPIGETWSCYSGGDEPCGRCDSCRIRDRALIEAGQPQLATSLGVALYAAGPDGELNAEELAGVNN
jgi:7-cyano-7-deazaguanine synthase